MQLTSRHLVALVIVVGSLALAVFLVKDAGAYAGIVGVVGGAVGVLYAASGVSAGPSVDALADAVRQAARGEAPSIPQGTPDTTRRLYLELIRFAESLEQEKQTERRASLETREAVQTLDDLLRRLGDGVGTQLSASEETARSIKDMTSALRDIAQHVEVLASAAKSRARRSSR